VAIRNVDQTALLASTVTNALGLATANLDAGNYVMVATAPGYSFAAYDTVTVSGAEADTLRGAWFDPARPHRRRSAVYGYLYVG
jgi:hypothetical protein